VGLIFFSSLESGEESKNGTLFVMRNPSFDWSSVASIPFLDNRMAHSTGGSMRANAVSLL
jgi:hypothetical protein